MWSLIGAVVAVGCAFALLEVWRTPTDAMAKIVGGRNGWLIQLAIGVAASVLRIWPLGAGFLLSYILIARPKIDTLSD